MNKSEKILSVADIETIERLADIVKSRDLSELSLSDGEYSITIKGKKCPPPPPPMPMPNMPMQMPAPVQAPSSIPAPKADKEEMIGNVIKSPIVGTFYASPSPDKAPFVREGKRVKKGEVLFIIESMKVMNEIKSEYAGIIKKIYVKNGDPIDYDQPIMVIE